MYVSHIRKVIEAARLLGVPVVNTFVGRDWTRSVDDNWPRFLSTWKPLIRFADDHGVKIGIENCPMLFTRDEWPGGKNLATSPKIWRRMFSDIPSPNFGLNYDPSHFIWQQMDYLRVLREFAPRLHHVHAKDARLDRDRLNDVGLLAHPNEYHTPKLPGLGDVEWGRFFAVLGDIGYAGPVCVEVEDRAFEGSLERRQAALPAKPGVSGAVRELSARSGSSWVTRPLLYGHRSYQSRHRNRVPRLTKMSRRSRTSVLSQRFV